MGDKDYRCEDEITIIENSKQARDEIGYMWGASLDQLTTEQTQALTDGKTLAINDGEYMTFISSVAFND